MKYLASLPFNAAKDLEEYCKLFAQLVNQGKTTPEIRALMVGEFQSAGILDRLDDVIDCLQRIGFLPPDPTAHL